MFAKGKSNVQSMIDNQYTILIEMIEFIDNSTKKEFQKIESYANNYAEKASNGDRDVYNCVRTLFEEGEEQNYSKCYEARKMLLCMIVSYYESVLNETLFQYGIKCKNRTPYRMLEAINEKMERKDETIGCPINLAYLLRNYYMHGFLSQPDKRKQLSELALQDERIGCEFFIKDKSFLIDTLDAAKTTLLRIESLLNKTTNE